MDIGRAFSFVTEDDEWITKIVTAPWLSVAMGHMYGPIAAKGDVSQLPKPAF